MSSHSTLRLKLVRFDNGERFPMLLNRSSGMPLFKPTVYAISMIRATNVASATISMNLEAIMHLYAWAEIGGFDLEIRFSRGEFLNVSEIDSLTEALGNRFDDYCKMHCAEKRELGMRRIQKIRSIEKHRKRSQHTGLLVDVATKAVRLRYVGKYLDWLATYHMRRNLHESKRYAVLECDRGFMAKAIDARVPTVADKGSLGQRVGLQSDTQKRLETIIDPSSIENPWKNRDTRIRNRLIVLMLLKLGIRIGELLSILVEDISFLENKVLIARTPDDKDDPRINEPNAKTRDRKLPFDSTLRKLLYEYITTVRNKKRRARKHKFLFVDLHRGKPLSKSAVIKAFHELRENPDLPDDLTPHVMRHTWNDGFSRLMDKKGVSGPEEEKVRSYLMGWKEGSGTASKYTRRHVQGKASEVSLILQHQIRKKDMEEDVPF